MVFGKEHDDSLEPYLPNKLENHQETARALIQWVSGGGGGEGGQASAFYTNAPGVSDAGGLRTAVRKRLP